MEYINTLYLNTYIVLLLLKSHKIFACNFDEKNKNIVDSISKYNRYWSDIKMSHYFQRVNNNNY